MTVLDILKKIMFSVNGEGKAPGKAWRLFFFIFLSGNKNNKVITNYDALEEQLKESRSTIKKWRDVLSQNKVIKVIPGKGSMTLILLPPYDTLLTCEMDDLTEIKLKSDPAAKRVLDRVMDYGNMSLFPIIVELADKMNKIEAKLN